MKQRLQKNKIDSQVRDVLYQSIFFRNMELEKADAIINQLNGTLVSYAKDEFVISEMDYVDKIGILLSGELCKVQHNMDGTELLMQKIKESYVVGLEVAVSEKQTSPYSMYAVFPSTVYWFSRKILLQEGTLSAEEKMWMNQRILYFLSSENIRQYKKIEILTCKSARERIMKYLEKQSYRHKSQEFEIEFNREQMANYLGLNRSVLSHELKKMEKEGLIQVRKNHFILMKGYYPNE